MGRVSCCRWSSFAWVNVLKFIICWVTFSELNSRATVSLSILLHFIASLPRGWLVSLLFFVLFDVIFIKIVQNVEICLPLSIRNWHSLYPCEVSLPLLSSNQTYGSIPISYSLLAAANLMYSLLISLPRYPAIIYSALNAVFLLGSWFFKILLMLVLQ